MKRWVARSIGCVWLACTSFSIGVMIALWLHLGPDALARWLAHQRMEPMFRGSSGPFGRDRFVTTYWSHALRAAFLACILAGVAGCFESKDGWTWWATANVLSFGFLAVVFLHFILLD